MPARSPRRRAANRWRLSVVVAMKRSACLSNEITPRFRRNPFITMPDDNPHWQPFQSNTKDAFLMHPDGGLHARFQLHFLKAYSHTCTLTAISVISRRRAIILFGNPCAMSQNIAPRGVSCVTSRRGGGAVGPVQAGRQYRRVNASLTISPAAPVVTLSSKSSAPCLSTDNRPRCV